MDRCAITLSVLSLLLVAGTANAQCVSVVKLTPADSQPNDQIGGPGTLAMSSISGLPGLMAGVPKDDNAHGSDAGLARFFNKSASGWSELTAWALTPTDAGATDGFGSAVAFNYPFAVATAPGNGAAGAVYFFKRGASSWTQKTKHTPSGLVFNDNFGAAAAISGDFVVVSATNQGFDDAPNNILVANPGAGCLYMYQRNFDDSFSSTQALREVDAFGINSNAHLGKALAMNSEFLVAGAPDGEATNIAPADSGYAKIWRRTGNTWAAFGPTRLALSGTPAGERFGAAVAIDPNSDILAIGAPGNDAVFASDNLGHSDVGAVHIFRRNLQGDFVFSATVRPDIPFDGAGFGSSVALRGGQLVIGAPGEKKVYVFDYNDLQGDFIQTLVVADNDGPDAFGSAVASDGLNFAIGDNQDDTASVANAGALYFGSSAHDSLAGDSCSHARRIQHDGGVVTFTGCTTGATLGAVTTCGGNLTQGPDVFYNWYPRCATHVVLDTAGSSFDTVLSVHLGCPGEGGSNTFLCDDDGGPGTTSRIEFDTQPNFVYSIRIAGYNGSSGTYAFNMTTTPPANDECVSSGVLSTGTNAFNSCSATSSAPAEHWGYVNAPFQADADLWFTYVATCTGDVQIDTVGTLFDSLLAVYPGGSCPSQDNLAIASNDDAVGLQSRVVVHMNAGAAYRIRVGGFGQSERGAGFINITCPSNCRADFNQDGDLNPDDLADYIGAYFIQPPLAGADFNADGAIDPDDLADFIGAYFAGCP